jgi:hypothetical protein
MMNNKKYVYNLKQNERRTLIIEIQRFTYHHVDDGEEEETLKKVNYHRMAEFIFILRLFVVRLETFK